MGNGLNDGLLSDTALTVITMHPNFWNDEKGSWAGCKSLSIPARIFSGFQELEGPDCRPECIIFLVRRIPREKPHASLKPEAITLEGPAAGMTAFGM